MAKMSSDSDFSEWEEGSKGVMFENNNESSTRQVRTPQNKPCEYYNGERSSSISEYESSDSDSGEELRRKPSERKKSEGKRNGSAQVAFDLSDSSVDSDEMEENAVKKQQTTIKNKNKQLMKKRPSIGSNPPYKENNGVARAQHNTPPSKKKKDKRTVEQIYTKKTQIEHILLRPDTYIGSTESVTQDMWVYEGILEDKTRQHEIVKRPVTVVPGLYKIFDEIIVNAADNKQRDSSMTELRVHLDEGAGFISIWNNGRGIPIVIHKVHGVYVPELIFGHLLTGSNFDDEEKKTTGGRNGYGAKLANIFSTEFTVETVGGGLNKKYRQTFRNNMSTKGDPEIKPYHGEEYTCVTFKPDWNRFGMSGLDADTLALMRKRVFDVAGCMPGYGGKRVRVCLNDVLINVKSFEGYMTLYRDLPEPVAREKINERWEVIITPSDGQFEQVSFVNAICTTKGGQHVNFIADQITSHLVARIKKKTKGHAIKPYHVKNHLCVCVNSLIENPSFDSQTKETLTTRPTQFGGSEKPQLSTQTLKRIEKSEVVESVLSWAKFQAHKGLNKKSGKKTSRLSGISKLDDANLAGTSRSADCTLILTEGDSAKALAVSGLGVVGRDYFGVFPLKGKLLNVRDASAAAVMKNEEIGNIVKIMGLKFNASYQNTQSLRYGHLMIMTDQDHDGSHIKGLIINFMHHFWQSLLQIPHFLVEFITPIVKCIKGPNEKVFFTIPEYKTWRNRNADGHGWAIKYYKGLGTSTAKEAKEYFARLDKHRIGFEWSDDVRDTDLIDMAFAKKRVEDRKVWINAYEPGTYFNYKLEAMTYECFINKELILFSIEDNKRSIPCMVDGLKPSQRKVLYCCFKRNLKSELKVAQLAGYVSEHSAYHHGEQSMVQTIVHMAQNFVGSNNINLLTPSGQFGTRLMGGRDSASARYIFTRLEKIARVIFHPDDDSLLDYLDDDGMKIEPTFYVPVIPMALVNGADGIGTGYSTFIPNYSPRDLIANIRRHLNNHPYIEVQPWYRGFIGEVKTKTGGRCASSYVAQGIIKCISDDTIVIMELPIKQWTQDYKAFLEGMLTSNADNCSTKVKETATGKKKIRWNDDSDDSEGGAGRKQKRGGAAKNKLKKNPIQDFKENHTDTTVSFTLTISPEDLNEIENEIGLMKFFRLESSLSTNNIQLFNTDGHIEQFTPFTLLDNFCQIRGKYYELRKEHLIQSLRAEQRRLANKLRFVMGVIDGSIVVHNRRKKELLTQLRVMGFDPFDVSSAAAIRDTSSGNNAGSGSASLSDIDEASVESDDDQVGNNSGLDLAKGFDYLLGMKIWSLTRERVVKLKMELKDKEVELDTLEKISPKQLWLRDLDVLEIALDECDAAMATDALTQEKQRLKARKVKVGGSNKPKKPSKYECSDSDSYDDHIKPKRKRKAAVKREITLPLPPPLPGIHSSHSTESINIDGKKVSAAFAHAETSGKVVDLANELNEDVKVEKNVAHVSSHASTTPQQKRTGAAAVKTYHTGSGGITTREDRQAAGHSRNRLSGGAAAHPPFSNKLEKEDELISSSSEEDKWDSDKADDEESSDEDHHDSGSNNNAYLSPAARRSAQSTVRQPLGRERRSAGSTHGLSNGDDTSEDESSPPSKVLARGGGKRRSLQLSRTKRTSGGEGRQQKTTPTYNTPTRKQKAGKVHSRVIDSPPGSFGGGSNDSNAEECPVTAMSTHTHTRQAVFMSHSRTPCDDIISYSPI